ncbi:hypothetical protein SNEBB_002672 [Seison nebaliae]|nr:hypothetical protein SNEBB_002672 [Seison nebaliae]
MEGKNNAVNDYDALSMGKMFVRGSVIMTDEKGTKEIKTENSGEVYNPNTNLFVEQGKKVENDSDKSKDNKKNVLKKDQSLKKSNLELFKEELKKEQLERNDRTRTNINNESLSNRLNRSVKNPLNSKFYIKPTLSELYYNDQTTNDVDDPTTTNIFLSNLTPLINEDELTEIFGRYGPLASIKIMWPRNNEYRGRDAYCGFVAFMVREDAEKAMKELNQQEYGSYSLRLSWGKAITIPAAPIFNPNEKLHLFSPPNFTTNYPFNATDEIRYENGKLVNSMPMISGERIALDRTTVIVQIPKNKKLLETIHLVVEFILHFGEEFEHSLIMREENNPFYSFLTNFHSSEHVYYRWKVYSLMNGDSFSSWRSQPFQMFRSGSFWVPPPSPTEDEMEIDEAYADVCDDLNIRFDQMEMNERKELDSVIYSLNLQRQSVGDALLWILDRSEHSKQISKAICEWIIQSKNEEFNVENSLGILCLINDIVHNQYLSLENMKQFGRIFGENLKKMVIIIVKNIFENNDSLKYLDILRKIIESWKLSKIFDEQTLTNCHEIMESLNKLETKTSNNPNLKSNERLDQINKIIENEKIEKKEKMFHASVWENIDTNTESIKKITTPIGISSKLLDDTKKVEPITVSPIQVQPLRRIGDMEKERLKEQEKEDRQMAIKKQLEASEERLRIRQVHEKRSSPKYQKFSPSKRGRWDSSSSSSYSSGDSRSRSRSPNRRHSSRYRRDYRRKRYEPNDDYYRSSRDKRHPTSRRQLKKYD